MLVALAIAASTVARAADLAAPLPDRPAYNRDIRPILADACFRCHGFDKNKRKADLRLDVREAALAEIDGIRPIVPNRPEESAIIQRLHTTDAEEVMPPPKESRQLTEREKLVLRRWIQQGAEYQDHWAFIPVQRPAVPAVKSAETRNAIDAFIGERLEMLGMSPADPADRVTLARRLHLDLTGLPPTAAEVESLVKAPAGDSEVLSQRVDQLLGRPQYGERMAVWWLDQVRFADTIGYHSDNPMPVSPFRDYVIRSFNENKAFHRFTVEQLAGDLMPDKSQETLVASGYNRLILSTEEGGAQAGQYEAKYLVDRVKSVGTTWLGQTYMCAECHDHKYDPVTMADFYSLGAFFADVEEVAVGKRGEGIPVLSAEAEKEAAALEKQVAEAEERLKGSRPELEASQSAWEAAAQALLQTPWQPLKFQQAAAPAGTTLEAQAEPEGALLAKSGQQGEGTYFLTATESARKIAGLRVEALPHEKLPAKGPGRAGNGNFVLTEVVARILRASGSEEALKFVSATADVEQTSHAEGTPYKGWPAAAVIDRDAKGKTWGWAILPEVGKPHWLVLRLEKVVELAAGDTLQLELRQNHGGGTGTHGLGHFRILTSSNESALLTPAPPPAIAEVLKLPADKRTEAQKGQLREHFRSVAPALEAERQALAAVKQKRRDLEAAADRCLITTALKTPRTVRILPRGDWQSTSGQVMMPATPKYLPGGLESSPDNRRTRLDLAQWLVQAQNPLTARVQVNRLWKLFFGQGLVRTLEDLGTQSEVPDHQRLLDWLAAEFVESGWNVKHMVRLMVTSRTYAQSSSATAEALARDPQNREWARGGRWRLDAEFVRDNALAISGLLVSKVGGRSVNPYQPAGYWENLNFPPREWQNSPDDNQWRRGLYTWWQRSFVHPAMLAFDAPTREECAPDRTRSNIPQQALVLLNDPSFVEASRAFALRILQEGGAETAERLHWAFRQATGRSADAAELEILTKLLETHRKKFQSNEADAKAFLSVGQRRETMGQPVAEIAAWTSVARAILNLHETITRS